MAPVPIPLRVGRAEFRGPHPLGSIASAFRDSARRGPHQLTLQPLCSWRASAYWLGGWRVGGEWGLSGATLQLVIFENCCMLVLRIKCHSSEKRRPVLRAWSIKHEVHGAHPYRRINVERWPLSGLIGGEMRQCLAFVSMETRRRVHSSRNLPAVLQLLVLSRRKPALKGTLEAGGVGTEGT
jgi:hypothetical protein